MAYLLPLLLTSDATIPGFLMGSPKSESSSDLQSRERRIARHLADGRRKQGCGRLERIS